MSRARLAELTLQVLEANLPLLDQEDDYWVTQRVTRGTPNGDGGYDPTVIVDCQPLPFLERSRYYRDGLPVRTPSVRRTPPRVHESPGQDPQLPEPGYRRPGG